MSPQQVAELQFWRGEYERFGTLLEYAEVREVRDLNHYAELLPEIKHETGRGLDLCCGLVSILGRLACQEIVAVDALMNEYLKIAHMPPGPRYLQANAEDMTKLFGDGEFDFVWCVNAVDHTPNPWFMLSEAYRVLKPGGRFYFMVNFDPALYAPHHTVWNMREVEDSLKIFKLLRGTKCWSETWQKYIYAGLYRKDAA